MPQALKTLQPSLQKSECREISLYQGGALPTEAEKILEFGRLRAAFPNIKPEFFAVLNEAITDEAITKERLSDSVKNILRSCKYATPSMAEILGFDKKVKLLTYKEYCDMINEGYTSNDFGIHRIGETTRWYLKR